MRVFAINLRHRPEKKAHILKEGVKSGLNIEIIEAVNGAQMSDGDIHQQARDFPECGLSKGEIGCALSHLSIYQKMVDEQCPLALVLEDDVVFSSDMASVLAALEKVLDAHKPQVVLLSESHYYIQDRAVALTGSYQLMKIVDAYYAFAYVINLKAAQALLKHLKPVVYEADRWGAFQQLGLTDVYCVVPPVAHTIDDSKEASDLEMVRAGLTAQRAGYLRTLKKQWPLRVKLKKLFWKLIHRHFVKVVRK